MELRLVFKCLKCLLLQVIRQGDVDGADNECDNTFHIKM